MSEPDPPGLNDAPAAFEDDYDEHSAEADADVAAGRLVPHERVRQWLQSIVDGQPEPTPFSWRK